MIHCMVEESPVFTYKVLLYGFSMHCALYDFGVKF